MNAPRLHHVGIVQSSEADAKTLMTLLGLEEDFRGYVETWSALCIFTKPMGGSPIEFIIPNGGPLERFNQGAGGLHHIALRSTTSRRSPDAWPPRTSASSNPNR